MGSSIDKDSLQSYINLQQKIKKHNSSFVTKVKQQLNNIFDIKLKDFDCKFKEKEEALNLAKNKFIKKISEIQKIRQKQIKKSGEKLQKSLKKLKKEKSALKNMFINYEKSISNLFDNHLETLRETKYKKTNELADCKQKMERQIKLRYK